MKKVYLFALTIYYLILLRRSLESAYSVCFFNKKRAITMLKHFLIGSLACIVFVACKKNNTSDNAAGGSITDDSANYTVSTFVGNGMNGPDSLTGGQALLYFPANIVFDAQGNLYIADGYNDRIRKVNSSGTMINFAGSTLGYAEGTGTAAQFARPLTLAIDGQGNLFVGEGQGLRIRKIAPNAVVTSIAGNGVAGLTDGIGTAAQIDITAGMATDAQGNIYFTQSYFHGVRKITPDGLVSSFAGGSIPGYADGTGATARFNEPHSLASDGHGNIYVSDFKNACIRKITSTGVVSTVLQRTNENEMHNMTRDGQGNFYIVQGDAVKTEIVKVNSAGSITKIAGGEQGYQDGPGNTAKFSFISGITTDASGNLYVTDLFNGAIRKIRRN
jgi:hypothetical protein